MILGARGGPPARVPALLERPAVAPNSKTRRLVSTRNCETQHVHARRQRAEVCPHPRGYSRPLDGMERIKARRTLFTASGVVKTLATSGSNAIRS